MRNKIKDWVKVNFSLDKEIVKRLKDLASFEKLTYSEFVELLVIRWDEGINPESKLNELLNERKNLINKSNGIETEIKKVSDHITLSRELKKQKAMKKPQALKNIENLLMNNEILEVERMAKFWQIQTGTPAIELIIEARDNIQRRGI